MKSLLRLEVPFVRRAPLLGDQARGHAQGGFRHAVDLGRARRSQRLGDEAESHFAPVSDVIGYYNFELQRLIGPHLTGDDKINP